MKEATGELNMTVITVVAIGAVAAIFYAFIWPSIQMNLIVNSACAETGGLKAPANTVNGYDVKCEGGSCTVTKDSGGSTTKVCAD